MNAACQKCPLIRSGSKWLIRDSGLLLQLDLLRLAVEQGLELQQCRMLQNDTPCLTAGTPNI